MNEISTMMPNQDSMENLLRELVTNLSLNEDGSFHHTQLGDLPVPAHLQQIQSTLSSELQDQCYKTLLRDWLYENYCCSGSSSFRTTEDLSLEVKSPKDQDEGGAKSLFCHQLHQSNTGKGYLDAGWLITQTETDSNLTVQKNNLTLWVHRDRHLAPHQKDAQIGETVAIFLPNHRMEQGYYVAIGDAGLTPLEEKHQTGTIVQFYFYLAAAQATETIQRITDSLNTYKIPFQLKLAYHPTSYQRHDAGILEICQDDVQKMKGILASTHQPSLTQPQNPSLFTKTVLPGISICQKMPRTALNYQDNSVLNRCHILADCLAKTLHQKSSSFSEKLQTLTQELRAKQIDIKSPHLICPQ
jgi:HopA1 effector protein family